MEIRRDQYVSLGKSQSLSLASLPPADQKLIRQDPVLSALVKDEVIRGSDFGKLYDRLQELDKAQPLSQTGQTTSRAEKMYGYAQGGTAADWKGYGAPRTRQGIFAT